MDNLQKAEQMARIKLMQDIQLKRRKKEQADLIGMALELILAGKNKQEIVMILAARENLSPEEIKVLEEILSAV